MPATSRVVVDLCDNLIAIETISPGETTGHSVLVSAEQWLAIVDDAEDLAPVRELRRQRSVAAAKEAAKHHTRGAA